MGARFSPSPQNFLVKFLGDRSREGYDLDFYRYTIYNPSYKEGAFGCHARTLYIHILVSGFCWR